MLFNLVHRIVVFIQVSLAIKRLGRPMRLSMKLPITEFSENGPGAQIPTGPGEWRISVHVFGVNPRTSIQKHLDGCFRAEGGCAVQGRFPLGSAIAHEVVRGYRWLGHAIGIRSIGQKHFDHGVVGLSIGCAERCVQRRFSSVWPRLVDASTLLDQILA